MRWPTGPAAASTTGMRQLVLAGGCCANRQLLQQLLPLLT
jgi:hydrogenase maturation protein HypF